MLAAGACDVPEVPTEPTWAHVEPILRTRCNHCHGATAGKTGAVGSQVYRLDFYDMSEAVCGEAAQALGPSQGMAGGWASLIAASVTPPGKNGRARMPPAPAAALPEWERDTLVRWGKQQIPARGTMPAGNQRPQIKLDISRTSDTNLPLAAIVHDPDGEAVVGILQIGSLILKMDRPGSFKATVATGSWPQGRYPVSAVLCDGWSSVKYELGAVEVIHGGTPPPTPDAGTNAADARDGGSIDTAVGVDAGGAGAGGSLGAVGAGGAGGSGGAMAWRDASPPDTMPDSPPPDMMRIIGECPDLDGNGTLDCKESLVMNPDFKSNVQGWTAEVDVTAAFATGDGDGNKQSGSMVVTNSIRSNGEGSSMAGARQCIAAMPGKSYALHGQMFIIGGQGMGAQAGVSLQFFAGAGCTGARTGGYTSTLVDRPNLWQVVQGVAAAPAMAGSVEVRLVVVKSFKQDPIRVLFDNILIKAR